MHIAIFKLLSHMVWVNFICIEIWRKLLTDDRVGPCRVKREARASLEENNMTLELILKDRGVCGSRSLPGTLAQGSVSLDVHGRKQQLHLAPRAVHSQVLPTPVLSADRKPGDLWRDFMIITMPVRCSFFSTTLLMK